MINATRSGVADFGYIEPFVPEIGMTSEFPGFAGRTSVGTSDEHDAVLLATAHED